MLEQLNQYIELAGWLLLPFLDSLGIVPVESRITAGVQERTTKSKVKILQKKKCNQTYS